MLRALYEAASRRDWDAAFSNALPDFELRLPEGDILSASYRAVEGIRRYYGDLLEPFEEAVAEPAKSLERGDQIVVYSVGRIRPRGSSTVVEIRNGHLWTIRGGKLARCELFPKPEQALEAAGLSEQDAH